MRWFIALLLLASPLSATAQNIPEPFRELAGDLNDEEKFVDAVRGFDRMQKDKALEAQQKAEQLKQQGDQEGYEKTIGEARATVEQIRALYNWSLGYYPNNARLQNYYGELLYDAYGDTMSAVKAWHQATTMDSDLPGPHNNLGLHYCHTGRYELGFAEMEKALKLDKKNPDYHFNMAQLMLVHNIQYAGLKGYSQPKIYRKAMKHSETAVKYAPEDYDILEDYAVNYFAAERFDVLPDWVDAAKAWQAAREFARNDTERFFTWLNEGRVWLQAKKPEKAVDPLVNAVSMMPDSEPALELLRRAREQVGESEEPLKLDELKKSE